MNFNVKNFREYDMFMDLCNFVLMSTYSLLMGVFVLLMSLMFTPLVSYAYIEEPLVECQEEPVITCETVFVETEKLTSGERIIETQVMVNEAPRMEIDDTTLEVLTRVVEAEVTGSSYRKNGEELSYDELLKSKIRVAQVYMNRVEDQDSFAFIDDLYESLTYKNASSTFNDGRYYTVEITDITREAVRLSLLSSTPDYTDGALYFASGTTTCKYGELLFVDDVGHAFFK